MHCKKIYHSLSFLITSLILNSIFLLMITNPKLKTPHTKQSAQKTKNHKKKKNNKKLRTKNRQRKSGVKEKNQQKQKNTKMT